MSQVLVVSEEIVRSMADTIGALQCDVETYKCAYYAVVHAARLVIAKKLLYSQISSVTSYSFACDILRDGIDKSVKVIEDHMNDVVDDDRDYCTECGEPLSQMSQRTGRCLNCVP